MLDNQDASVFDCGEATKCYFTLPTANVDKLYTRENKLLPQVTKARNEYAAQERQDMNRLKMSNRKLFDYDNMFEQRYV